MVDALEEALRTGVYSHFPGFFIKKPAGEEEGIRWKMMFYITKQLGPSGPPDTNKRFIHHHPARNPQDDEIVVCKASDPVKGWTAKDDKAIDAYIRVLNDGDGKGLPEK